MIRRLPVVLASRLAGVRGLIVLLSVASLTACTETALSPDAPMPAKCSPTLHGIPPSVAAEGARVELALTTTADCAWRAASEASWIQVDPASGQGAGVVALAVAANTTPSRRDSTVLVNDRAFAVAQDGVSCRFALSHHNVELPAGGGSGTIEVIAPDGCPWTANSHVPWIRIVRGSGSGNGTAEFVVEANRETPRQAMLWVASVFFEVEQDGVRPRTSTETRGAAPAI